MVSVHAVFFCSLMSKSTMPFKIRLLEIPLYMFVLFRCLNESFEVITVSHSTGLLFVALSLPLTSPFSLGF